MAENRKFLYFYRMRNSFLSIVTWIQYPAEMNRLPGYFHALHRVLASAFSDFEIIVVNNTLERDIRKVSEKTEPEARQHVFWINLSSPVDKNHAIMAGLDRANGDYAVLFELDFEARPEYIPALYDKSQEGFDIVYLRGAQRRLSPGFGVFYRIFYFILRRYSNLQIDPLAHNTRIISRRALNAMLRLRENLRFMKAIYSMVGYRTSHIPVQEPLQRDPGERFSDQFRNSLAAITSYTSFLRSVLLWIFIFSLVFLILVVVNAVKVKLTNIDLMGQYHETVSGWAFLVVMLSIFFAITCLNLYIMSIYLSNIYSEIKQRPLYIVESMQRL